MCAMPMHLAALRRWVGTPYRSELFGRMVELRGNRVQYHGCEFDLSSRLVATASKAAFIFGTHERPEIKAVLAHIPRDLPVVDFGGAIGVVSCIVNRLLTVPSEHVVVEANPKVLPLLELHRATNRCEFEVVHAALSYVDGLVDFHPGEDYLKAAIWPAAGEAVSVPSITLREILLRRSFATCSLVVDVEGAEVALVAEELDVLRDHVQTMIVEVHPAITGEAAVAEMLRTLHRAGFRTVMREAPTLLPWRQWAFRMGLAPTTCGVIVLERERDA